MDKFETEEISGEEILVDPVWRADQEETTRNEEAPRMENYSRRCLPEEFVGMKLDTILVDPAKRNI